MTDDIINNRVLGDENEHFLGEVLDKAKMKRLGNLKGICEQIAKIDPSVTEDSFPFTERSRNGSAAIVYPRVGLVTNKKVSELMSQAFAEADAFCISCLEGAVRITFFISDMWKKFSFDNDESHKGEEWHGNMKVIK